MALDHPAGTGTTQVVSAVTCLYDLGRDHHDGRSVQTYIKWLNATLQLPLRFDIFFDPAIPVDLVRTKSQDIIHRVPLEEFPLFARRSQIADICARHSRLKGDLTFRLPDYSMLVQSKLEMIQRA